MLFSKQGCRDLMRRAISLSFWFDDCWPASRKYWFSLLLISVICAKCIHIYSHLNSLPFGQLLVWGPTFFLQDFVCALFVHCLCAKFQRRWARIPAALVVVPLSLAISGLSAANISFYVATGAEIHWRQAHNFHGDAAAVKTLLTGLTGLVIVEIAFVFAAWFTTPHLYNWCKGIVAVFKGILPAACRRKRAPLLKSYEQVAPEDWDEDRSSSNSSSELQEPTKQDQRHSLLVRVAVLGFAAFVLILRCTRPSNTAYEFLSETVIVTPFGKGQSKENASVILPELTGDYSWLGNHTALAPTPKFDWLPAHNISGFSDWYANVNGTTPIHYNPKQDPLHISNLDNDVLEPLRKALDTGDVNIKHVLLLKLESTRADVFPLRKESFFGDVIAHSFGGQIPVEVEQRLANLTPTAERLMNTASGFSGNDKVSNPYGGLHTTNAYTSDTFTLKSILATVCGVAPLVVDFNQEYLYHIYQPCMPHILEALNGHLNNTEITNQTTSSNHTTISNHTKTDDYTSWPWRSTWMQAITDDYDNQDLLTPAMGFKHKVTDLTIDEDYEKSGRKKPNKYNFWGYVESELADYFRDAINNAEKNKERLFISHLTGITHHPWDTPDHKYEEMMSAGWWGKAKKVNRYLNTLGVADDWLALLLDILEETGAANETLVVMAGDHGISLPENSGVTPYDNPHVASFHVPIVFAHPQLPPIEIDSRTSYPSPDRWTKNPKPLSATSSPLYEGQSMIRPTIPEKDGKQDWQFSVMNTGGTWLALRSAAKPYRLIIPLISDVEWRFSNVDLDPHELKALQDFNLLNLMDLVLQEHDEDAVQWVNDAAHVAKWWVEENWRRYEYTT
ncbi:hypothetical protein N7541_000234 [Penicillium brevicompactum]|uniref:Sulfatase N-terminal domain-containing protein n=1 Tax=Penicillium brevicompactum TaxID=5074 RepID=A0A9W9V2D2_PENBR|nr:hypothetical protein N7541_000234 [Penicillium brevicompactum]